MHFKNVISSAALCLLLLGGHTAVAQQATPKQKVIIDTDIGDDIDDAFALALALRSPELQILQIDSAYGDTHLRARLLDRFLHDAGAPQIPFAQGVTTHASNVFTQRAYAEQQPEPDRAYADAVGTSLDLIRKYPGEVTLIAIAPLSNIGAMIDRDPDTFRKLKRVVLMGGSIHRGYGDLGYEPDKGPEPEWNIKMDIGSAGKLFQSGVPVFVDAPGCYAVEAWRGKAAASVEAWIGADGPTRNSVSTVGRSDAYSVRPDGCGLCSEPLTLSDYADAFGCRWSWHDTSDRRCAKCSSLPEVGSK